MPDTFIYSEECVVRSIEKGQLRDLLIVNLDCNNLSMNLDMISSINTLNVNEKVNVIFSASKPEFGVDDFCAHGYVVTEKRKKIENEENFVTIISFFGPLLRISSKTSFLERYKLNIMDHIYFCIKKQSVVVLSK
ncbi:DNA-directed RNA polymerase subunit G [Metallosphaera tengchongensis]|uniref:DNA-directed RNA polymerase subunit Rpo8 n=1 Tax=Metallosphaera tengchongensis TaxID=1532350 RepID=A0A6N0NUN5_9CREN|nr:DNA-directed RNA polymerase subunit G [Metallosphaera tengchongensis]QKQ99874.1 DNA-directed RNA polymerase subunit G [Metallosphaera tengchongensis]